MYCKGIDRLRGVQLTVSAHILELGDLFWLGPHGIRPRSLALYSIESSQCPLNFGSELLYPGKILRLAHELIPMVCVLYE